MDLNILISSHAMRPQSWNWRKDVVVSYNRKVLTNYDGIQEIYSWVQSVHEEADNRMVVHIKDMLEKCITNVQVHTLDTDVIVILLSFMAQFNEINDSIRIVVDFGTGEFRRNISINHSFAALGESVCLALPFFHTFSGCDSTCSFYQKTKKIWFESWMKYPNDEESQYKWSMLTTAFQQLSWLPSSDAIQNNLTTIEKFLTFVYGQKDFSKLDDARFSMFSSSKSGNLRELPPSQDALKLHILRSAFQAGWVWGNILCQKPILSKDLWG